MRSIHRLERAVRQTLTGLHFVSRPRLALTYTQYD